MFIEIECAPKGSRAKLVENGQVLYESNWHPRPGCATREVMAHMLVLLGKPGKEVRLQITEWK